LEYFLTKKQKLINGTSVEIHGHDDLPVVVLIHGLGLNKDMWKEFIPSLLKNYKVINFDLFGHGDSESFKTKLNLDHCARQIYELLHHLEIEKAHLIGFSVGGMINRKFALIYPSRVLSLVILNSPHKREKEMQELVEKRAKLVLSEGALATLNDALERWFTAEFRHKRPDVLSMVRKWRKIVDQKNYAEIAEILATGVKELTGQEINNLIPTLVITCEHDSGSTCSMAVEISKEYLYSDLVIIPKFKHLGLLESPSLFLGPILKFLERVK